VSPQQDNCWIPLKTSLYILKYGLNTHTWRKTKMMKLGESKGIINIIFYFRQSIFGIYYYIPTTKSRWKSKITKSISLGWTLQDTHIQAPGESSCIICVHSIITWPVQAAAVNRKRARVARMKRDRAAVAAAIMRRW